MENVENMDSIEFKMKKKTFDLPLMKSVESLQLKIGDGVPMKVTTNIIKELMQSLPPFHRRRYMFMTRCYDSKQHWKVEFSSIYDDYLQKEEELHKWIVKRVFITSFTYFVSMVFNHVLLRKIHKMLNSDVIKIPWTRRELLFHFFDNKSDKMSPSDWFRSNLVFPLMCHVLNIPFSFTDPEEVIEYRKESVVLKIVLMSFQHRIQQIGGGPRAENELYEALTKRKCCTIQNVKLRWLQESFKEARTEEMVYLFRKSAIDKFESSYNFSVDIVRSFANFEQEYKKPPTLLTREELISTRDENNSEEDVEMMITNNIPEFQKFVNSFVITSDQPTTDSLRLRNCKLSLHEEIKQRQVPYHVILEIIQFQLNGFEDFTFFVTPTGIYYLDVRSSQTLSINHHQHHRPQERVVLIDGFRESNIITQEGAMRKWFGRIGRKGGYQRICLIFPIARVLMMSNNNNSSIESSSSSSGYFLRLPKDLKSLRIEGSLREYHLTSNNVPNIQHHFPIYLRRLSISKPETELDQQKIMKLISQNKTKLVLLDLEMSSISEPKKMFSIIREKMHQGRREFHDYGNNYEYYNSENGIKRISKLRISICDDNALPINDLMDLFIEPFPGLYSFCLENTKRPPSKYILRAGQAGPHFLGDLRVLSLRGTSFDDYDEFIRIIQRSNFRKLRVLDVSECGFHFDVVIRILNCLRTHLLEFKCNGCDFGGDEQVSREGPMGPFRAMESPLDLYPALRENSVLERLIMEGCNMTKTRIDFLCMKMKGLKFISFYHFGMSRTVRMMDFLYFLDHLKKVKVTVHDPPMTKIVVENCKTMESLYVHFLRGNTGTVLNYVTRNCSECLKFVAIEKERYFLERGRMDRVDPKLFEEQFIRFTNIRRIFLWNASMEPRQIRRLLKTCPNLREIRVKGSI